MRLLPLLLLLLVLPAPASAMELAVQDDAVLLHRQYGDAAMALDRAVEMNAERVRANLSWSGSMPAEQAQARRAPEEVFWDFSALDRLYEEATSRGLLLQVTLTGPAPAWATANRKAGNVRPDAKAYGAFVRAAAETFAGRVDRWSIWNEPNWHRLLSPARSAPSIYRGLFRAGRAAIRRADPDADVLIGELMPGANTKKSTPALRFLRAVTCSRRDWKAARRCSRLEADGFALHPYQFARRPKAARPKHADVVEIGSLSRLTRALDRLRARRALVTRSGARMPLYLTEFGYFTHGPLKRSPRTHARWMREAWQLADRNPRVRQLLQYELVDPWPEDVTWRSAVLERDGTPRPVFHELRELAGG